MNIGLGFWVDILFCRYGILTIANVEKIRSAAGAVKYATGLGHTKGGADDYFRSENIGHAGVWHDPAGLLKEFDINHGDKIDPAHLLSLLEGKNPKTGVSLFANKKEKHAPGTELEISVPKDVSTIWAASPPPLQALISTAIQEANDDALNFVQNNASYTRFDKGGKTHVKAPFVAAIFAHGSSRGAQNELGGDPHRHDHDLIMNFTKTPTGQNMTLENSYIFEYQKAIGSQFRASLASKLQNLGFEIERKNDGTFGVPGVPKELIKLWSSRREQMKEKAIEKKVSLSDKKGMKMIQQSTRRAKIVKHISDLITRWKGEAKSLGFEEKDVVALTKKTKELATKEAKNELIKNRINETLTALVETDSVFTRADLITILTDKLTGVLDEKEIMKEAEKFVAMAEVVKLGSREGQETRKVYMSTRSQIAVEQAIPLQARELATDAKHYIESSIIEAVIDKKKGISEEQADAVKYACSEGSLKVIAAFAGTGKSFLADSINRTFEESGYTTHILAPTWKAAHGVGKELGIERAAAIAGFLIKLTKEGKDKITLGPKDLVMIDESGMVGTRSLNTLLSHLNGAKLVLLGDPDQLNAIESGPALSIVLNNIESKRIENIRRQNDPRHIAMVTDLANGRTEKGVLALNALGGIKFEKDGTQLMKTLIADWARSTKELGWTPSNAADADKSHLIVAVRNDDVFALNQLAREVLRARGLLTGDDVTVECHPTGKNTEAVEMQFAIDDRVVLRLNELKKLDVINKDEGVITDIQLSEKAGYDITLKMASGAIKTLNTKEYVDKDTGHFGITHGYAVTMYASQGMTVRRAFAVADGMGQRYSYVGLSRHKESVTLYANKDSLRKKVADKLDIKIKDVTSSQIMKQLTTQMSRKTDKLSTLDFDTQKIKPLTLVETKLKSMTNGVDKVVNKMNSGMESVKKSLAELKAKIQGDGSLGTGSGEDLGSGSRTPAEIAKSIKANIEAAKSLQLKQERDKAQAH